MSAEEYAEYIQREPGAMVMADEDTILVAGHGGVVPLSFAEARDVAATITNLLAVHDPEPHRPAGLELLAERYGVEAVQAATPNNSDEPTVELGRMPAPYDG